MTADALKAAGMQVRKYRLRTAICEDRARDWIRLAREEGMNDTEIISALGCSTQEFRELMGIA